MFWVFFYQTYLIFGVSECEVLDLAAHPFEQRPLLRLALHDAHHALRLARRHDPVRQKVGPEWWHGNSIGFYGTPTCGFGLPHVCQR